MVIFTPDSWRHAGQAVKEASDAFRSGVTGRLGGLANTGADGGMSMVDGLIAGILPAVMEAVDDTIDGISTNLAAEGEALIATGDAYAEVEDAATEIGSFMDGEY